MSGASSQRKWRFYLDDMSGFAERVMAYTGIVSNLRTDSTMRCTICSRPKPSLSISGTERYPKRLRIEVIGLRESAFELAFMA